MPSHKLAKISSDIARVISEILFEEAKDEILKTKRTGYQEKLIDDIMKWVEENKFC